MTIIIRIGPTAIEIFWALIALLGVLLMTSGFFNAFYGLTDLGRTTLVNVAAISNVSGGIVIFILGLFAAAAGYFGIRGRIIITTNEDTKQPLLRKASV